jgi:hypothetical protein
LRESRCRHERDEAGGKKSTARHGNGSFRSIFGSGERIPSAGPAALKHKAPGRTSIQAAPKSAKNRRELTLSRDVPIPPLHLPPTKLRHE